MQEVLFIPTKSEGLREAIRRSFEGDSQLHRYYDRASRANTVEGYTADTLRKCLEFSAAVDGSQAYVISDRQEVVGFVVLNRRVGILYSFGVRSKSRRPELLKALFDFVKSEMQEFVTYMNDCNTRAIKWLQSCGMQVRPKQHGTTFVTLEYKKCQ